MRVNLKRWNHRSVSERLITDGWRRISYFYRFYEIPSQICSNRLDVVSIQIKSACCPLWLEYDKQYFYLWLSENVRLITCITLIWTSPSLRRNLFSFRSDGDERRPCSLRSRLGAPLYIFSPETLVNFSRQASTWSWVNVHDSFLLRRRRWWMCVHVEGAVVPCETRRRRRGARWTQILVLVVSLVLTLDSEGWSVTCFCKWCLSYQMSTAK